MKNHDVIPADRELAIEMSKLAFEDRVPAIAAHRERHSVMAGEHIGIDMENLIVLGLKKLDMTEAAEELINKISNSYYVVLTPFSEERAAQMIRDRSVAKEYIVDQAQLAKEAASKPTWRPHKEARFVPSERMASDALSFREQVALDALKIMMANGYFGGTPDVDAEKCWQIADELIAARERIDRGQAQKEAEERASLRELFEKTRPTFNVQAADAEGKAGIRDAFDNGRAAPPPQRGD